ncbi:MAG: hypothetical protein HYV07_32145 [Deltaproteobacteria bacterium]|nr:hypothetical protein [Deltaproteobacteria bacterium]
MSRSIVLLGLASGLAACGASPEAWPSGRPRIDGLEYLQQTPGDPFGLEFHFSFVDDDGDLGSGTIELFVDDATRGALSVADVFRAQSPSIPSTAVEGDVDIVVHLDSSIESGEEIEVGFELLDAGGRRSNRPTVTLVAQR